MSQSIIYQVNSLAGVRGVLTSLSAFSNWQGTILTASSALSAGNSNCVPMFLSGFQMGNSNMTQDPATGNVNVSGNLNVVGTLSAGLIIASTATGGNTTVQFNTGGNFAGNRGFTYNPIISTAYVNHVQSTDITTGNVFLVDTQFRTLTGSIGLIGGAFTLNPDQTFSNGATLIFGSIEANFFAAISSGAPGSFFNQVTPNIAFVGAGAGTGSTTTIVANSGLFDGVLSAAQGIKTSNIFTTILSAAGGLSASNIGLGSISVPPASVTFLNSVSANAYLTVTAGISTFALPLIFLH